MDKDRIHLLVRIVAFLVGGLFLYAGIVKALDPLRFANDINNYHLVPWSLTVRAAFYLPWLEIVCGLGLIFHRLFSGAVAITFALMVVFLVATVSAKVRGIDISCGCFGSASSSLSFGWHLLLDLAILGALLALWLSRDRTQPAIAGQ
jgi:putative oxidoreductase